MPGFEPTTFCFQPICKYHLLMLHIFTTMVFTFPRYEIIRKGCHLQILYPFTNTLTSSHTNTHPFAHTNANAQTGTNKHGHTQEYKNINLHSHTPSLSHTASKSFSTLPDVYSCTDLNRTSNSKGPPWRQKCTEDPV